MAAIGYAKINERRVGTVNRQFLRSVDVKALQCIASARVNTFNKRLIPVIEIAIGIYACIYNVDPFDLGGDLDRLGGSDIPRNIDTVTAVYAR
ncbi:hypothetical protein [Adlercreutzia caecimuris]|uniref:hypothetical protein n=1 Tax=Adlercreutzia caecimuris TaxID=671266 RepID=UPI001364D019|nr:hypothetical protein [Adlercreutzia caecimuris]